MIIALEAGVRSHGRHQEALFLAVGDIKLELITDCLLRFSNYFTYISLAFLRSLEACGKHLEDRGTLLWVSTHAEPASAPTTHRWLFSSRM